MGCPAPKIFNNGEGSALLNDIKLAQEIVKACKRATDRPVTVKMRSGIDEDHIVAKEFAAAVCNAGADAITIHARTKNQGYAGDVDYELVGQIKSVVDVPVIVSGNCVDKKTYDQIKKITNADGVMIGRAAIGHPEVFMEILGTNQPVDKFEDSKKHIEILSKYFSERYVVLNLRSHLMHYLKGVKVDVTLKLKLMAADSLKDVLNILNGIFEK